VQPPVKSGDCSPSVSNFDPIPVKAFVNPSETNGKTLEIGRHLTIKTLPS
jgi:hypothetical protein